MASSGSVLLIPKWKVSPAGPSLNEPGSSSRQVQAATSRESFEAKHIRARAPTPPRSPGRVGDSGDSQNDALAAAEALSGRPPAELLRSEASQPKEPASSLDDERWASGTAPTFSPTRQPPVLHLAPIGSAPTMRAAPQLQLANASSGSRPGQDTRRELRNAADRSRWANAPGRCQRTDPDSEQLTVENVVDLDDGDDDASVTPRSFSQASTAGSNSAPSAASTPPSELISE